MQLAHVAGQQVQINTRYDMWQLGTFIYKVVTVKPHCSPQFKPEQLHRCGHFLLCSLFSVYF